jgi:hypothetical protein
MSQRTIDSQVLAARVPPSPPDPQQLLPGASVMTPVNDCPGNSAFMGTVDRPAMGGW